MLRKLVKHEFRQTWKTITLLLSGIFILCLISGICFYIPNREEIRLGITTTTKDVHIYLVLAAFAALILLPFLVLIHLSRQFQRSMYSPAGYLTHTLPVKPSEILSAKFFVSFLWSFAVSLVDIVSYVMIELLSGLVNRNDISNFFRRFGKMHYFDDTGREISSIDNFLIPWTFLVFLLAAFDFLLITYTAISLGQLALRQKKAAAVFAGILAFLLLPLGMGLARSLSTAFLLSPRPWQQTAGLLGFPFQLAVLILLGVLMYFINLWVVKKKLNLE